MGVCYAFSTDGIRWQKPELGLLEFNGSPATTWSCAMCMASA